MEFSSVILIVVDTLRKDYSTPLAKRLKEFGFVEYQNAISPAPWTVPAHASIFTGLYPCIHKAHETKNKKGFEIKLKHNNLISSSLRNLGYGTYLVTANPYIRPSLGFTGFEHFYEVSGWAPKLSFLSHDEMVRIANLKLRLNNRMIDVIKYLALKNPRLLIKGGLSKLLSPISGAYEKIAARLKNWPLNKGAQEIVRLLRTLNVNETHAIFLFINLMETHEPYFLGDTLVQVRNNLVRRELDSTYVTKWRRIYPEEVEYVSQKIMEILGILKEKGIFSNSLIIITSDHGQLLGEYGRIGHGTFLYDELLRVPLLIKYPADSHIEVTKKTGEYISLTSLKQFILNFIENKISDDSILYSKTVFAESYGIGGVTVNPKTEEEKRNVNELEKYRIAIYYKNFKGIFNVTDWKFEKIKSYDSKIEVTDDIIKHMKKEIVKFLKTATVAKVPKIKI